jgi:hypothetical protein
VRELLPELYIQDDKRFVREESAWRVVDGRSESNPDVIEVSAAPAWLAAGPGAAWHAHRWLPARWLGACCLAGRSVRRANTGMSPLSIAISRCHHLPHLPPPPHRRWPMAVAGCRTRQRKAPTRPQA